MNRDVAISGGQSRLVWQERRETLMFVVKGFERSNALPATIGAVNDRAMAQGRRQSCKTTVE
jgi:hypothetical protein